MKLSDPVETITGIGPKLALAYKEKGIEKVEDLLLYLPRKYDDFSHVLPVKSIRPGQVSIKAKITNVRQRRGRRGLSITEAIASDDTDSVRLIWFNQPYRAASIKAGEVYFISGNYKLSNARYSLINPSIELATDVPINSARILATYPESKTLKSTIIRRSISQVLPLADRLNEFMPSYVTEMGLMSYNEAIKAIHFPQSNTELNKAKLRLQFNELFPLLLASALSARDLRAQKSLTVPFRLELAKSFVSKLPFALTDDQRRVIWQIYQDIEQPVPMNRLVEGDVGSGKTVVAVMAAVMAMAEGYCVAFMAPTELLARQHADTIYNLLKPLGLDERLVLLTGSMKRADKIKAIEQANTTKGSFVVGTHSLLTSGVDWTELALIIIDEQHRFGVDQRLQLQRQAGHLPHFLSITATPIPRSLALTILNDLDLSRLKTMPLNRKPIKTQIIPPSSTDIFFKNLSAQLAAGHQAYIVSPYIHPKDDKDKLAAESLYEIYKKKLNKYAIGLVHGQLPADEQEKVMKLFLKNEIKVLVATTVIEVGVDVSNATVMAIYGPERFGLAQLHQLRGRVGRGKHESHCFLMLSDPMETLPRIRQFQQISDGFKLSELDLSLRGPGAIYGKLQHGKAGSSLLTLDDQELIGLAQSAVNLFFEKGLKLLEYNRLAQLVNRAQKITYLN